MDLGDRNGHAEAEQASAGARIEARRAGVLRRGTVQYADDLQVLVKWDDGSSSSLRVGRTAFRLVTLVLSLQCAAGALAA